MNYKETLAEIRNCRIDDTRDRILDERVALEQQYRDTQQRALEAAAQDDYESAKWHDADLAAIESEVAQIDYRLDEFDRAQQPQGLSAAKQEWISRRGDLAAQPGMDQVAAYADAYVTQQMGVPPDTPEYFELMQHALEPAGYEPMATPDDIAEVCGIDADTYNKGVERLYEKRPWECIRTDNENPSD